MGTELAHPGETLRIDGQGFAPGDTVRIGQTAAPVSATTARTLSATVPAMPGGTYAVQVCAGTRCSPRYTLVVASAAQIPVNVTMRGLPALTPAQHVYLTGTIAELGGGSTAPTQALGPMLLAHTGDSTRFLLASLPACQTVRVRAEIVSVGSGTTTTESTTHSLSVPCQGEGAATITWNASS